MSLALACGLGVVVPAHSLAQSPRGTGAPQRSARDYNEHTIDLVADEIGLDETTKHKVQAAVQENREQAQRLHKRKRVLRRELNQLLRQDEPDEAEVMKKADQIGRIDLQLLKLRMSTLLRVRRLLTPEQRRRLIRARRQARQRMRRTCRADIDALCPNTTPPWRCLVEQRQQVSMKCKDELLDFHVKAGIRAEREQRRRNRQLRRARGVQ